MIKNEDKLIIYAVTMSTPRENDTAAAIIENALRNQLLFVMAEDYGEAEQKAISHVRDVIAENKANRPVLDKNGSLNKYDDDNEEEVDLIVKQIQVIASDIIW